MRHAIERWIGDRGRRSDDGCQMAADLSPSGVAAGYGVCYRYEEDWSALRLTHNSFGADWMVVD